MDKPVIGYDQKWLLVGLLIALLHPIFSGLIIGLAYYTDPRLRREGQLVLGFSVIWAIIIRIFAF
jgi:zinc transporter ZupT